MSKSMQRDIDQMRSLIRDLQAEVARLKAEDGRVVRSFPEVCFAAVESGNTIPDPLTAVASNTQIIDDGTATILEIVDDSGTLKLKRITNAAGSDKATITYYNATKSKPSLWSATNEPIFLTRLRDGRWVRFPVGSNPKVLTANWLGKCVWPDCFSDSSPKKSVSYSSQKGDWSANGVEIVASAESGGSALKFHNASTWLYVFNFYADPVDAGYTDGWVAGESICYSVNFDTVGRPYNGLMTPVLGGTGVAASAGVGPSQIRASGLWVGTKVFAANDVWDLYIEARMWRMSSFGDSTNPKVGINSLAGTIQLIRIDDSLSTYSAFVDAGIIP